MNFNKFKYLTSENRCEIGRKDLNGIQIRELDVLLFDGIVKEYYFVEYDDFYCAFRLRSSVLYKGSREFKGGCEIIGCITDFDFKEPNKKHHNITSTYSNWSNKISKEVLKQLGL